jgi:predicted DNA-binding transcriptional regulator AlpA
MNARQLPVGVGRHEVLWTCRDVADFLVLSYSHVRNRIIHEPSFPRPRRLGGRIQRWVAAEVKEWAGVS